MQGDPSTGSKFTSRVTLPLRGHKGFGLVTYIIFSVSEFVDCARWFDTERVHPSVTAPLFAGYLRRISLDVYMRDAIAENTADYILRAFTLKHNPSRRATLPQPFTWLK